MYWHLGPIVQPVLLGSLHHSSELIVLLACSAGGRGSHPFHQSEHLSTHRAFRLIHRQTDLMKPLLQPSMAPHNQLHVVWGTRRDGVRQYQTKMLRQNDKNMLAAPPWRPSLSLLTVLCVMSPDPDVCCSCREFWFQNVSTVTVSLANCSFKVKIL